LSPDAELRLETASARGVAPAHMANADDPQLVAQAVTPSIPPATERRLRRRDSPERYSRKPRRSA
jgi:hypothetical protein